MESCACVVVVATSATLFYICGKLCAWRVQTARIMQFLLTIFPLPYSFILSLCLNMPANRSTLRTHEHAFIRKQRTTTTTTRDRHTGSPHVILHGKRGVDTPCNWGGGGLASSPIQQTACNERDNVYFSWKTYYTRGPIALAPEPRNKVKVVRKSL